MVDTGKVRVQSNLPIGPSRECQLVAMIEELKERLQLMVPIGASTEDMQHEIELGWSRKG